MISYSYKLYGSEEQFRCVDAAIQTTQFIRNTILDVWVKESKNTDRMKFGWPEMARMSTVLRKQHDFCGRLYSDACQVASDRAWASVKNFYEKCKNPAHKNKKKGYPRYRDNCRSVEYKKRGWFFSEDFRKITFRCKTGMGTFDLKGGRILDIGAVRRIQRVRIVRKHGHYYLHLVLKLNQEAPELTPTECATAFDLGLKEFMTSHLGEATKNPRFLQKAQKKLARAQRKLSRKKKGGKNRKKQAKRVSRIHAQVANQRLDFARKLARCVVMSNDVVVFEDLNMAGLVKGFLTKSIHDVGWGMFMHWMKYYCEKFGRQLILVDPANTTQACSACGCLPTEKITLAVREYHCEHCGLVLDRDLNAAINILKKAILLVQDQLATAGHAESWSYILHCLKKALSEVYLLNVFGERTSTSFAQAEPASQLVELETASMFTLKKFDDFYEKDYLTA